MDWIKVLNRHVVFEYNDLSDSEFRAWIKIMSLTAFMEQMPTHEQMVKYVHHKTLTSLQDKLKKHSTTLQDILKKVLTDAQEVGDRKKYWKDKKKEYRERDRDVHVDIQGKAHIEKEKEKEKEKDILPEAKISFSHKERKFSGITKDHFASWEAAFPAVNIDTELAKMEVWLLANPKNRKSNYERFFSNWLTRAQDKAARA